MNCWQRFSAAAIVLCSNAAAASSFPAHSAVMQLFLDNYRADGGFMATSAFREMDPEGALSLVVEVSDHVSRTGDRQQAQSLGRCAVRLFRFLERYEMPDGLLANLPSCVFSEKSVDKGSGRGVSLSASALYARALESTARLYGRRDWRERSIRVRKAVLERSSSDGVACEGLARVGERESRHAKCGAAPKGNLLGNAGFELGPAGWNVRTRVPQSADEWRGVEAEETDDAHTGKRALKISNPDGRSLMLTGYPVAVCPGTDYVLSAWAKASAPCEVTIGHLGMSALGWHPGSSRQKVGKEWERIVLKMRASEVAPLVALTVSFDSPVTLTLDDMQFEAGEEPTSFAPRSTVETAFVEKRTWSEPGRFDTEIRVARHGGNESDIALRICATNALTGWNWSASAGRRLATGEVERILFSIPLENRGIVTLTAIGDGVVPVPWTVAVLEPQVKGKADLSRGFSAGVNGVPSIPVYEYPKNYIYYSCGESYPERLAALRACGVAAVRLFPSAWLGGKVVLVHPDRGPWDFSRVERLSQFVEKSELEPFVVVDSGTFNCRPWATNGFDAVRNAHYMVRDAEKTQVTNAIASIACHPRKDDWIDFVEAAAKFRFGGARWFEICNEPNLTIKEGAAYLSYLKAAYVAVKAIDPSLGVVGISATEDFGCDGRKFFEACCRMGGKDYADAMSFHPYRTQLDNSCEPAEKTIRWMQSLLREGESEKPLWNTECFYIHNRADYDYCKFVTKNPDWLAARNLLRRLVIDAGEGVRVSTPLRSDQLFADPFGRNGVEAEYMGLRPVPGEAAVVQAFALRLLYAATSLGSIADRLPDGVRGYAFKDGAGSDFAVIWILDDPNRFGFSYSGRVRDMYGNEISAKRDFVLDERPLVLSGRSIDGIVSSIRKKHGDAK